MKPLYQNDTIQIELTNYCPNNCSNCSRFCNHIEKPFFMEFGFFKKCIDSLEGFPEMVSKLTGKSLNRPYIGIQGGECCYHSQFKECCEYLQSKFPKEQCGFWTTLPKGKEHFREIICDTFGHIFINSHEIKNIIHHPFLIQSQEVVDKDFLFMNADNCPFQSSWSASINERGAWFCEIAGALSVLKNKGIGWDITPGWWKRTNKDYTTQIETFCPQCGGCIPLRRRTSIEEIDDISPNTYEQLKDTSPKIKKGQYKISNLKLENDYRPMASYKNLDYRKKIASRYGIGLFINESGFWTPYLLKEGITDQEPLLEKFRRETDLI